MTQALILEITDLAHARRFLENSKDKSVTITNPPGSAKYYGMRVLNYIFKKLSQEFPQITKIIVNVEDDNAALFTAIKLGYVNINYESKSEEGRLILKNRFISSNDRKDH